jgi:hypothetical protein
MKIRLIEKITILTLFTVSIVGCYDYLDDDYDHGGSNVLGRRNASLDRAISWYEEQKQGEATMLKFATGEEQLFYTEPSWKYRLETRSDNSYTLEVDLTDRIALDFVTDENAAEYESTGDFRYKHSVTRLIIRSNEETGDKIGFLMTIIPSPSFTKQFYRRMNKNTYLNRDPDFDGLIVYHNLDGTFSNGWKYVKGEIITSLIECTACEDMISYQAIPASYKVSQLPATRSGGESIYGGELPEVVITGGGGGGGGGGYSGGSSGGYSGGGGGGSGGYSGNGNGSYTYTATLINITGTTSKTIMNPCDLTVTISPNNPGITLVKYTIQNQSGGTKWTLYQGKNLTCNTKYQKAGYWTIDATVTLSNGQTLTTNAINLEVMFPDVSRIENAVRAKMVAVWTQTKDAASSSGSMEKGFAIFVNTTTCTYECGPTIDGPTFSCEGEASVHISGNEYISSSPVTGGKYLVADFHTHPPLTYCSSIKRRQVGPSSSDVLEANSTNIPGFLYDYVGSNIPGKKYIGIIGGHNINAAPWLYVYGPDRRATPN